MSIFEQSRYYFNYVLPDIILSNLNEINNFLSQLWWLFFIFLILLIVLNMNSFRKNLHLRMELKSFNEFYKTFGIEVDTKSVELSILESAKLIKARFSALYELRGETYVLVGSNALNEKKVSTPLKIGKRELNRFEKSGNFNITYFSSSNGKYMILFYSLVEIEKDDYIGHFNLILEYYNLVVKSLESEGSKTISNIGKDTAISLVKLQMDKYQFFKFFIALIMKLTKAKGARLLTKKDELVFEYQPSEGASKQKVFYIRNTPYKLEYFDDKELNIETITQVGSFLDMSGAFLENIDKNSEMVKNYLELLNYTNDAMELESRYYKHHSLMVQIISVELAKSLFLNEDEIDTISLGATLHDIGMVGDLLSVLDKDKFDETEMNLIKEHPLIGSIMVEPISHIYPISDIIKYHHERFDGRGYPFGIKESQIPIGAQVVSMGEFYVGITSDRSYKKGKSHLEAVEEIKKARGKIFSPLLVDIFVEIEKSIEIKILKIKTKKEKEEKNE